MSNAIDLRNTFGAWQTENPHANVAIGEVVR
jgi:hypothetical protein